MTEQQIIKQLNSLKSINPDPDFAESSRLRIIYQAQPKPSGVLMLVQGLSASLSMGLAVVFLVFAVALGVSNLRSPLSPVLEGVGGDLTLEADKVSSNTEIHLEEVQYVTDVASKALAQKDPEGGGGSKDEEIDDLLDQAINL